MGTWNVPPKQHVSFVVVFSVEVIVNFLKTGHVNNVALVF